MATAEVFKYVNPKAARNLDARVEIGLDTIRFGYRPHPISWHHIGRLKARGWRYIAAKKCWRKRYQDTGIQVWHSGPSNGSPGWVGIEGSLARVLQPDNSNMTYDWEAAFSTLKQRIDEDVLLEMPSFERVSPPWSSWFVNRVDVTADVVFERADNVLWVIDQLRKVRIANRTRSYQQQSGMKWASRGSRINVSVYDKHRRDPLQVNIGKLRLTVVIQDKKEKRHLGKYCMKSVSGLMNSTKWLRVVRDEVFLMRPTDKTGVLRLIVGEAWKAQSSGKK